MTASLPVDLVLGFVLAVIRGSAFLLVAPPFNTRMIPAQVKVALAIAMAIPVAPAVAESAPSPEVGPLIMATLFQIAAGLALGFIVQMLFAAVQAAGELIDLFAGFTIAATYDPFTNANQAVFGRFYQLLAVALLFALDGHLLLVRGFLDSFEAFTVLPEELPAMSEVAELLIQTLSTFFLAALEIAAPVLAALFLTEVALGLLSKAAPQMNVFMLGFPVKILLAIGLVGLTLPLLPSALDALVRTAVRSGNALMGGFG
jgi:flagellar biosynthetic protein FliR